MVSALQIYILLFKITLNKGLGVLLSLLMVEKEPETKKVIACNGTENRSNGWNWAHSRALTNIISCCFVWGVPKCCSGDLRTSIICSELCSNNSVQEPKDVSSDPAEQGIIWVMPAVLWKLMLCINHETKGPRVTAALEVQGDEFSSLEAATFSTPLPKSHNT